MLEIILRRAGQWRSTYTRRAFPELARLVSLLHLIVRFVFTKAALSIRAKS